MRSDERFARLFEAVPTGMLIVDATGSILMVNRRAARAFGYEPDELVGEPIGVLIPERFHAAHANLRSAYQNAPMPRLMGGGRDMIGRRKDGAEVVVEVGLSPLVVDARRLILASVTPREQPRPAT